MTKVNTDVNAQGMDAQPADFAARHIGPDASAIASMLKVVGYESLEALTDAVVPDAIRWKAAMSSAGRSSCL